MKVSEIITVLGSAVPHLFRHTLTWVLGGFAAVAMAALVWSFVLTLSNQSRLEEARSSVDESFRIKLLVNEALRLIVDVETGVRGFALTKHPAFLESLKNAEANMQRVIVDLSAAVSPDPGQAERADRFVKWAYGRLNHAHTLVRMVGEEADETAINGHAIYGEFLTGRIRELAVELWEMEATLFTRHSDALADSMALSQRFTVWLMCAVGVLLVVLGVGVIRLRRAKALVKICAWSKTIEYKGEWLSFEEYLNRRFGLRTSHGINPEEAEKFLARSQSR